MKRVFAFRFLIALLALLPAMAHAQGLPGVSSDTPIEITADALEVLQENQRAIFKGNVVATQGTLRLKSDTMTVHYRKAGDKKGSEAQSVSQIEVNGHVHLATPGESAKSQHGLYEVDAEKIYLKGDVVLTKGENVVKGSVLEYDLATGRSQIVGEGGVSATGGGGKKERVRGLFMPDKK